MTSPPDKLFRDGLEKYKKTVPASAWDRISSNLEKPNKNQPRKKILFGLLLLGATCLVAVLWLNDNKQTHEQVNQNESNNTLNQENPVEKPIIKEIKIQIPAKKEPTPDPVQPKETPEPGQKVKQPKRIDMAEAIDDTVKTSSIPIPEGTEQVVVEAVLGDPKQDSVLLTHSEVSTSEVRTSITYSMEDVQRKFLKKDLPADATSEKESTSGLKKVIASVVKPTSEASVFTGLRKKKNELLRIDYESKDLAANK